MDMPLVSWWEFPPHSIGYPICITRKLLYFTVYIKQEVCFVHVWEPYLWNVQETSCMHVNFPHIPELGFLHVFRGYLYRSVCYYHRLRWVIRCVDKRSLRHRVARTMQVQWQSWELQHRWRHQVWILLEQWFTVQHAWFIIASKTITTQWILRYAL